LNGLIVVIAELFCVTDKRKSYTNPISTNTCTILYFMYAYITIGAWGGVVVKALVPGSIPGHWGFFPGHQTVLKMSTRIFLGVKTAGDDLTTFMCRVSRSSGALAYQKPQRPLGL